ncbi:MAG: YdcF family protein [Alphaproteobacteria bacterium]|nr:YdcF family protein [Alphaproteobacteria bacterium]
MIAFLLSPLNVAILLLSGAMLALHYKRPLDARKLGFAAWLVLVVFGALPTGQVLLQSLEGRYPFPAEMPRKVDGIILLGGFVDTDLGVTRGAPQLEGSVDRLFTFTDMAQKYPYSRLVVTSGIGNMAQTGTPEAQLIKPVLEKMRAYTRSRLTIEDKSRTTWENATLTKELLQPKSGQTWLLVTSAWHMPRAMGAFKAAGWEGVVPVPSDYLTDGKEIRLESNFVKNMRDSATALREIGGIVFYSLTGQWK